MTHAAKGGIRAKVAAIIVMSAIGTKRTSLVALHMSAFGSTADRPRLLLGNPNKIRHFLQSVVPVNRAGTTMGRPKQGSNNPVGSPSEPGLPESGLR